jgi:proteasome lid subunit RPN8/RPN11
MSTRRLVVERDGGRERVLSLPLVTWQPVGASWPPRPTDAEAETEIRLALADAGILDDPLVGYDDAGQVRLLWPSDLEEMVAALAPAIRRERRARRARRLAEERKRKRKPSNEAKRKRKADPTIFELVQSADGRWLPGPGAYIIPQAVLDDVREHAERTHRERPQFESLGAFCIDPDGKTIARYTRMHNPCTEPLHADITPERLRRREGDLQVMVVHSHPPGAMTRPSPRDLQTARAYNWRAFAIQSDAGLRIWRPDKDGVAEIPWVTA